MGVVLVERFVFELLAPNGCLQHQTASWKSEHHHSVTILGVDRGALLRSHGAGFGAHFKIAFFEMCQRFGGFEEDHFIKCLSAGLRSDIDLRQRGFANRLAFFIYDSVSMFGAEKQTSFADTREHRIASRSIKS